MSYDPEIITLNQWLKQQMDDPDVVDFYGLNIDEHGRLHIERPKLAQWAYQEQVRQDSLNWYAYRRQMEA